MFARARALASVFAFALVTGGCAVSSEHDAEGDTDADEAAASTTPSFYAVRQDFRKCMFPMCGGVWYRKLNNAETRCLDGGKAAECYAATLDTSAIKGAFDYSTPILYVATVKAEKINGGRWAKLVATEAWKALTTFEPKESIGEDPRFYSVKDNGIRCITAPCFSLDAKRVNLSTKMTLSGLDLSAVEGGDTVDLAKGIVAFGSVKGSLSTGRTLTASQAYVKVESDPKYCTDDSQCGYVTYPRLVTSTAECYCPTCPTAGSVATNTANQASWQKYCNTLDCPPLPCAPPPPVACVANSCSYSAEF